MINKISWLGKTHEGSFLKKKLSAVEAAPVLVGQISLENLHSEVKSSDLCSVRNSESKPKVAEGVHRTLLQRWRMNRWSLGNAE